MMRVEWKKEGELKGQKEGGTKGRSGIWEGREGKRIELSGEGSKGALLFSLRMTSYHLTLASWAFGQP